MRGKGRRGGGMEDEKEEWETEKGQAGKVCADGRDREETEDEMVGRDNKEQQR